MMMQVARARKASWMSSRRSHRMRSRLMPWYQAIVLFDDPPVHAQAGALGLTSAGDPRTDAFGAYGLAVLVVVVGAVGEQLVGAPARSAAPTAYGRDLVDQRDAMALPSPPRPSPTCYT
ncbi:hypothetical protein JNW87_07985 [Micromonospora sp. ATA51]|nr:hypothetical protein [Micromonospora sp. ATA51]